MKLVIAYLKAAVMMSGVAWTIILILFVYPEIRQSTSGVATLCVVGAVVASVAGYSSFHATLRQSPKAVEGDQDVKGSRSGKLAVAWVGAVIVAIGAFQGSGSLLVCLAFAVIPIPGPSMAVVGAACVLAAVVAVVAGAMSFRASVNQ